MKKRVLFLCTGNSCRSQMGEGLLRYLYGEHYEVFSAGTKASFVNPKAIQVMREIGIDISHHTSKVVDEFLDQSIDLVFSVCDHAKESCPIFPQKTEKIHHSFLDPAHATGTEEEILQVFRDVRDQIKTKLEQDFKPA